MAAVPAALVEGAPSSADSKPGRTDQPGQAIEEGPTEAQQRLLFSGMLASEFYSAHGVEHSSGFITNSRGMKLYSHVWTPAKSTPKALICCCHGYGDDTSWMFQLNCIRLAENGYAVCALDYEGHGQSEGLRAGFRSVDAIVRDCIHYFTTVRNRLEFQSLPLFLVGESLGGAIALLIVAKTGSRDDSREGQQGDAPALQWSGCVLLSPMLRIKEEMRPHWLVVFALQHLVHFFPDAAIVPTPDTIMLSCRDPDRLKLALANPYRYAGKPRLGVAMELVRVTDQMAELVPEIKLPFIVVHGEADVVTDCFSSKELYAKAGSQDKTLKLYPGGGHKLLQGEAEVLREEVWQDILAWLREQVSHK